MTRAARFAAAPFAARTACFAARTFLNSPRAHGPRPARPADSAPAAWEVPQIAPHTSDDRAADMGLSLEQLLHLARAQPE